MSATTAAETAAVAAAAADYRKQRQLLGRIDWPPGVRMAVNFTCDFDAMLLRRLLEEPPLQRAQGEFGGRVGIWRLLELFDRQGVKATIFTPGRICELYPRALRHAAAQGHEIADHMWEHRVPREPELERDHLRKSTAALAGTVGRRPVGTRSGHSPALLCDEGYIYDAHGTASPRPYYVRRGEATLLYLPFHFAIDDAMFFSFAWLGSGNEAQRLADPDRVFDLWWTAFCQQYDEGGYLNVCLHPYVSGRALRIAMLDRLIARMKEREGVWLASCEEVARHCLAVHPPSFEGVEEG